MPKTVAELPIPTVPEELPFVPAAERKTHTMDDPDFGEIVLVGHRAKKRKRAKDAGMDGANTESTKRKKPDESQLLDEKEDITPFDYASAPNLLDAADADTLQTPRGKKKDKRKDRPGKTGEILMLIIRVDFSDLLQISRTRNSERHPKQTRR